MWRIEAVIFILGAGIVHGAPKLTHTEFGKMPDGTAIQVYTLTNRNGVEARITNYGGILVSVRAPDRNGVLGDVVLGFESLAGYLNNPGPHFGALVGRYANRIGHAGFSLGGMEYKLPQNDGENTLHGGPQGFDKKVWTAREAGDKLELSYLSKDGEAGFPGNLKVTVTYRLSDKNELRIDYSASSDRDTVINLTSHGYFNLKGVGSGDVLSHQVMINADRFTPVDRTLIPTGELRPVTGTPFDFRKATAIGARIDQDDEQIRFGRGYDHNWVLNTKGGLVLAARVEEPMSGRVMEVYTTEPGVQFYTGNFLDGSITGRGGAYGRRSGLSLETQHFPDSPNKPAFPSTVLKAGREFRSTTAYRFLLAPKKK